MNERRRAALPRAAMATVASLGAMAVRRAGGGSMMRGRRDKTKMKQASPKARREDG